MQTEPIRFPVTPDRYAIHAQENLLLHYPPILFRVQRILTVFTPQLSLGDSQSFRLLHLGWGQLLPNVDSCCECVEQLDSASTVVKRRFV